jgi:hypothetical protein
VVRHHDSGHTERHRAPTAWKVRLATLRCGRPGRSRSHRARLRPRHEVRCAPFHLRRRRSLPNTSSSITTREPVLSPRLVVCVSHAQDVRPERRFSTPHDGQDARPRARLFAAFSLFFIDVELFRYCLTISAQFSRIHCRYNRSELQRDVRRPPSPHHARARSRRERERERELELELELEPEPTPTTTPTPSSPASKLTSFVLMSVFWVAGCAPTKTGPHPV